MNRQQLLLGLFVGLLVGMNLLGGKITTLFGVSVSVSIFMMPLSFLITDIVAEVYGRDAAKAFVHIGLITLLIILAFTIVFTHLPPHPRYPYNEAYVTVFGSSIRILFASCIAFFISQLHDIWAFEFWRNKTQGRWLWLRNNLSTGVSQAIDTLLFMLIAFYQTTPKFDVAFILQLAIPFYLFKLGFALLDTPFVYLGVYYLTKNKLHQSSS
ncbi:MAG: queuosine precursor transporter [Bdellovibrionota bacterium]|nr:queuosine precursor transporter [Deltaproteobacteria bacterium]